MSSQYRLSTGTSVASASSNSMTPGPAFRSVQYHRNKGCKTVSIKITKATMRKPAGSGCKKPEFNAISQTHIDLVDATANVEFVTGTIQRRWGDDYVLVTNDGLELEDVPATQGQLMLCIYVYVRTHG